MASLADGVDLPWPYLERHISYTLARNKTFLMDFLMNKIRCHFFGGKKKKGSVLIMHITVAFYLYLFI